MQRQQTRDTTAELAVRRLLHRAGLRYRVDTPPLSGTKRRADVVFRPSRVALFIDGCFWHGCPDHGSRPTHANTGYWPQRFVRNQERDRTADEALAQAGWPAIRVWNTKSPRASRPA